MANRDGSGPGTGVVALAILVWVVAIFAGFTALWRYKSTPGRIASAHPETWPAASVLPHPADRAVLVMFAHPHCPCTQASISELARLMAHLPGRLRADVVMMRPEGMSGAWERTSLWDRAAAIPDVTVVDDAEGREAARFHAATSGLTLVYDHGGELLFAGGITASRGHEGDSFGRRRIVSLLTTGTADRRTSPVFGCALFQEGGPP